MQTIKPLKLLDKNTINQIAAGEVVERPSSVIKELVDNAIDAGSKNLLISLDSGGRLALRVVDDGHGMSKEDALIAIERHGTSKISTLEDLDTVSSLGFRGEALPSIASVSKFELRSKRRDQDKGVSVEIDGGELKSVDDLDCQDGTSIKVESLFFNTPARKKFLKSERSESSAVKNLLIDYYCCHPEVSFKLIQDGKESLVLSEGEDFFSRAKSIIRKWKVCSPEQIRVGSLRAPEGEISVNSVFAPPLASTSNTNRLRILLNSRPIRDKIILKAVKDSFGGFLKPGKYPIGIISIEVPYEDIDLNVHPQKTEVRFRSSESIYRAVTRCLRDLLATFEIEPKDNPISDTGFNSFGSRSLSNQCSSNSSSSINFDWSSSPKKVALPPASHEPSFFQQAPSENTGPELNIDSREPVLEELNSFRFLGQALRCFLLFEKGSSIFLLDQHAAHERVVFNEFVSSISEKKLIDRQVLLIPEKVILSEDQAEKYGELEALLTSAGFLTKLEDDFNLTISEAPAVLAGQALGNIIDEALSCDYSDEVEEVVMRRISEVIAKHACHNSVRAGREVKEPEAYALLNSIADIKFGNFCPHGRPVLIELGRAELETRFGRRD